MTSEIICNVSDTDASFRNFREAQSRILVGDEKVLIPVELQQQRLQD